MSGGSYEYLFIKDSAELMERIDLLSRMSDRLAGLGYAEDAANETEELIVIIRQAMNRIDVRARRLRDVWRAIEWLDSFDSTEEYVKDELVAYRDELVKAGT
jgi:hypothetical protein